MRHSNLSECPIPSPGWLGELNLSFVHRAGRTILAHRRHHGPLQVQRPFYPETDGPCHVYLLHPPGGVVGGDILAINVTVETGAQALITTPAAGKYYRSAGAEAQLTQKLIVAADASLEWLPQEAIVYDSACIDASLRVDLKQGSHFIGWDIVCLGRRAAGETFDNGQCRMRFGIWRTGEPLILEQQRFIGGDSCLTGAWGLAGYSVSGTFIATLQETSVVDAIRADAGGHLTNDELFSVTQLQDVLLCRYLGHSAERAREYFTRAWSRVRPALLRRSVVEPRIWKT